MLTDEGRSVMGEVQRRRRLLIEDLVRGWDEPGQSSLGTSLTRLNDSLLRSVADRAAADRRPG
jgi:hypothetical protein